MATRAGHDSSDVHGYRNRSCRLSAGSLGSALGHTSDLSAAGERTMTDGYSRRTVLRGVAGGASALALPAAVAAAPGMAVAADDGHDDDHEGLSDRDRAASSKRRTRCGRGCRAPGTRDRSWATGSSARPSTP